LYPGALQPLGCGISFCRCAASDEHISLLRANRSQQAKEVIFSSSPSDDKDGAGLAEKAAEERQVLLGALKLCLVF